MAGRGVRSVFGAVFVFAVTAVIVVGPRTRPTLSQRRPGRGPRQRSPARPQVRALPRRSASSLRATLRRAWSGTTRRCSRARRSRTPVNARVPPLCGPARQLRAHASRRCGLRGGHAVPLQGLHKSRGASCSKASRARCRVTRRGARRVRSGARGRRGAHLHVGPSWTAMFARAFVFGARTILRVGGPGTQSAWMRRVISQPHPPIPPHPERPAVSRCEHHRQDEEGDRRALPHFRRAVNVEQVLRGMVDAVRHPCQMRGS